MIINQSETRCCDNPGCKPGTKADYIIQLDKKWHSIAFKTEIDLCKQHFLKEVYENLNWHIKEKI